MIRIWSEHLDYADARSPEVVELLEEGGMHPIFAVRPDSDLDELAGLLGDLESTDLEVALWPLLEESAGYWPSVQNAGRFADRLAEYLEALEARGVAPDWVAFDLEPALEGGDGFADSVRRAVRRSLSGGLCGEPYDDALETYRSLIEQLAADGIRTLGVTAPTAVADLGASKAIWQRSLETPWEPLPWDRVGVMAYGSMTSGYTRGLLSYRDVRALHYEMFLRMRRHFGARAHASVGITGTGVFGDEPVYERPSELARDVSAARAAAVEDIAVFCLEGLLEKPNPGVWVEAITEADPDVPEATWRAESVLFGSEATTRLLGGLDRVFGSGLRTGPGGS